MFRVAADVLGRNEGIPLATSNAFPSPTQPGVWISTVDASGEITAASLEDDTYDAGVGGYAFRQDRPARVVVVSHRWPRDIAAALEMGARRSKDRVPGAPTLSMAAAELFCSIALAAALVSIDGDHPSAIIAVGDCAPAAGALNAATSPVPQMALLSAHARGAWQKVVAFSF